MDEFMAQALPVAFEKYNSDDSNNPATTAEEYLSRVRNEAKLCPDVVVADIQDDQGERQVELQQTEDQVEPTLPWSIPTRKWQLEQSEEYDRVRLMLNAMQEQKAKEIEGKSPVLPRMKDELGWCGFCLGTEFQGKYLKAIAAAGEDPPEIMMDDGEAKSCLPEDGSPRPPLITILLNMDQTMIQQVLDYHIHWLPLMGFTIAQGCWIYALMACLAKPLIPDCAASLRAMARTCRNIRLTVENENDERLPSLNLLIALVANYFDQGDLMDKG
ncbi:putative gem-associated protein 2 [Apostichopus japonicus]|uniref:Gem-associated protein 2 n=1 Tax=Stichopus japonicus TaxID=307972 RepID=A0A2G8LAG5_STIJA|nr:putative gem-associated protein 2 [Apostichopus japonicus]